MTVQCLTICKPRCTHLWNSIFDTRFNILINFIFVLMYLRLNRGLGGSMVRAFSSRSVSSPYKKVDACGMIWQWPTLVSGLLNIIRGFLYYLWC